MPDRERTIKGLEWIVNLFGNYERHAMDDEEIQSLNDAIMLLKEQEAIVRCKDCKYRYDSINCQLDSEGLKTPDDWYCADGKRR